MSDSQDDTQTSPDSPEAARKVEERSRLSNVPAIASPDSDSAHVDECMDGTDGDVTHGDVAVAIRPEELIPWTAPSESASSASRGATSFNEPGPSRNSEPEASVSHFKKPLDHVFEVPKARPLSASRLSTTLRKHTSEADTSRRKRGGNVVSSASVGSDAHHWGKILSQSYQVSNDNLLASKIRTSLRDAESLKRRARRSSSEYRKMRYRMQATSLYCDVAGHYDEANNHLEAMELYEYALEQHETGLQTLRVTPCAGRGNIIIVALRMMAWLSCKLFMSRGMAMKRAPLRASQDELLATALSLDRADLENLPEHIAVSSETLLNVAELQDQNDLLVNAVAWWAESDEMAEYPSENEFVDECETAVDTTISMTSTTTRFMDYIRESLSRLDHRCH